MDIHEGRFASMLREKEVEKENAKVDEPQPRGKHLGRRAGNHRTTPRVSKPTSELDVKDSVDRTEKGKKANKPGNAGPFHTK